jgi:serine/threonine protein kinase
MACSIWSCATLNTRSCGRCWPTTGRCPRTVLNLAEQLGDALGVATTPVSSTATSNRATCWWPRTRVGPGHFHLSGFGITKRVASGPSLTGTGQVLGTVDYIAPEQIEGRPVDRRTDVYALGALIYECLTGRVPSEHDHDLAVLLANLREDPPPQSTVRPDVLAAVDACECREPRHRL